MPKALNMVNLDNGEGLRQESFFNLVSREGPFFHLCVERLVEGKWPRALALPTEDNTEFPYLTVSALTEQGHRASPDLSEFRKHMEFRRPLQSRSARDRRSPSGFWCKGEGHWKQQWRQSVNQPNGFEWFGRWCARRRKCGRTS